MKFKVVITHDPEYKGYVIDVPELVGCMSQGKTIDEALVHIFINTLTYYMLDILYLLWHDDNKGGYPCQKIVHIISF